MGAEDKVEEKGTPNPDDKKVDDKKPGDGAVDDKKKDEVTPPEKKEDKKDDKPAPKSVLGGDDEPAPEKKDKVEKKDEPVVVDYSGVKLGEASPLALTDRDEVIAEARELGLTPDQAQKLLVRRERSIVEYGNQLYTQLTKDPELGGDHLEETMRLARRGRDYLFPRGTLAREAMLDLFEHAGVGNHPEWVRAFARVGKDLDEDKTLDHKEVVNDNKPPLEKRLYKNSQPAAS